MLPSLIHTRGGTIIINYHTEINDQLCVADNDYFTLQGILVVRNGKWKPITFLRAFIQLDVETQL